MYRTHAYVRHYDVILDWNNLLFSSTIMHLNSQNMSIQTFHETPHIDTNQAFIHTHYTDDFSVTLQL